ncbi:MAG: CBS domain-containing protein [Nanoarchaeota archaeon]|nr:CBS domain-containing protein [Nanoarchaeota archaeon]
MIKAKTIMTENVITINENSTITEAAKLMVNKHVTSLLVTKNNMPTAIVTENDLIRGSLNNPKKVRIKNIMSKNFLIIGPNATYPYILKKLRKEQIKRFPVVENNKLIGIITETDIVDATRDFTRFHQIMQEIILTVFGLVTAFFLFFFSPLGQSIFR